MDLHCKLRNMTKELHAQIERSAHLKKIIEANITIEEYQCLLELFYGYIAPCERRIQNLCFNKLLVNREKTLLLENDLLALDLYKYTNKKIRLCSNLPILTEYEHVLGYLYVLEGSTLGGQVIIKILSKKLNITPAHGASYFNGYGKNTKAMWNDFCQILSSITTYKQQNRIIDSANLTYITLNTWLESYQLS